MKQFFQATGEEARRVFRLRSISDWVYCILAVWTGASSLTLIVLNIHLMRTWGTFIFFFLPALICFGSLAYLSVRRLLSPHSQRYGTWMLFKRTSGSLWPARLILIVPFVFSLVVCTVLIWGFIHL